MSSLTSNSQHIGPLLDSYFEETEDRIVEAGLNESHINVDHINILQFNPNQRGSTKVVIRALIHKVNPNIPTQRLTKDNLIQIFYQVYNIQPVAPPCKFSVCPGLIGGPLHKQQLKNEI
ncbi:hypothetical protein VP01_4476g4 [Puccinia sorghi]|uniref:Uncharacterized protein n=1 Tax=Puccinia sorghi TaxID=27349 RepID=A0A0L6UPA5_9BASI|nr:hypothetical protein VP01_4476g4 [Puccinia sorghi]